jgi:hypothetical protein
MQSQRRVETRKLESEARNASQAPNSKLKTKAVFDRQPHFDVGALVLELDSDFELRISGLSR